jgi:cytoskeletal protein CcmA (bactofilin family)
MTDTTEPSSFLEALDQPERAEEAATAPPAAAPVEPEARPAPRPGDPSLPPRRPRREGADIHRMVVGREIKLSGTISACDQLLVEGTIEADLTDCDDLQIAEMGLFKGCASIGEADIRGRFEGTLIVRNLIVRASAKVTGKIRYAQLQIERGGQISGDVVALEVGDEEI